MARALLGWRKPKLRERCGPLGRMCSSTSQRKSAPGSVRVAIFSVFLVLAWRYRKVTVPLLAPVQICGYLPVRQRFWPAPVGGGVGRL